MIVCCGEALIDMVGGEAYKPLPGGSPFNTAVTIGKMGVPVSFLSRFSSDFFSEILLKRLRDNKVGEELLVKTSQNTTLAFVKTDKNKEAHYVFYAEGSAGCSFCVEDLPKRLPSDTSCIVFGSIAMTVEPFALAIETLIQRENAIQSLGKDPPVISFDPNVRPFMVKEKKAYIKKMEKWISSSTIVKMSAADFEYIYPGVELNKALHKVLAMGPRLAICTQGVKGASAMLRRNDGNLLEISAPTVNLPVVDTIGAGDSFHGAFLSWLEFHGKMSRSGINALTETELFDALYFANKAASITCSRMGAEPPSRKEVEALKTPKNAKTAAKKPAAKTTVVKPAAKKAPAKKK